MKLPFHQISQGQECLAFYLHFPVHPNCVVLKCKGSFIVIKFSYDDERIYREKIVNEFKLNFITLEK
jgi:hypothetical protein